MTAPTGLNRLRGTWRLLLKELGAFGVVGAVCFALDLGLFQVLYTTAGFGAVLAKLTSTVVSTTVAYLGHRYWSFSHRARTGVRREYLLFAVVNGLTLALGLVMVAFARYGLGQESALVLQAVNVVSIGLGTVIRYLCYRQWVFPSHDSRHAVRAADPEGSTTPPELPSRRLGTTRVPPAPAASVRAGDAERRR